MPEPLPDEHLIRIDPNMILIDRVATSYVTFTDAAGDTLPIMTIEYHGRINHSSERRVYTVGLDLDTTQKHAEQLQAALRRLREEGVIQ